MRIQRKRVKGWRMPPNTIYVGRPTKWANPYRIGVNGNRDEVVELYKDWLREKIEENPKFLEPLKGKDVACWCRLDEKCHADVIIEALGREEGE